MLNKILLCCTLLLTACVPVEQHNETTPIQSSTEQTGTWSVSLDISGGFAGLMQRIRVDHSGSAVYSDLKRNTESARQLSPTELQACTAALKALSPADAKTVNRFSKCRDCYLYNLVATDNNKTIRITTDDTGLQDSGAKELIQMLTKLASDMRKNQ